MAQFDINFYSDGNMEEFLDRNLELLGIGSEGVCYRYYDKVIKVLSGPDYCVAINDNTFTFPRLEIDERLLPTEDYITRYSNIDNSTFVFAKGIFRFNQKLRGLVMPYINMPKLNEYKLASAKFDQLISACNKCKRDITLISSLGIEITDLADVNIYYDGKIFKIADTMDYLDHDCDTGIQRINMLKFSDVLISYFTVGSIKKSLRLNKDITDLYNNRKNLDDPVLYFEELQKHLSDVCGEQINSFSNASTLLKKMKI